MQHYYLSFLVPANITSFPRSTYASPGGTANFTCGTQGFDQPMVFWGRFNGLEEQILFSDEKFVIAIVESNTTAGTLKSMYVIVLIFLKT